MGLGAPPPATAVDQEYHRRVVSVFGAVDIEALPPVGAVRDIPQDVDARRQGNWNGTVGRGRRLGKRAGPGRVRQRRGAGGLRHGHEEQGM